MKTEYVLYKCADGIIKKIPVSDEVASVLRKHHYKEEWQLRTDKRFCSATGYIGGETEMLIRNIYDTKPTEDEAIGGINFEELLRKTQECLTETQYRRFLACCLDGNSYIEIARLKGTSESAIRNSIRHAKRKIKKILG